MNSKTLIIAGSIILILLLIVWGYLLFFGTPRDAGDVFSNFDFGPDDDASIVIEPEPVTPDQPVVDVKGPQLRQLTTRQVAGFKEVQTSTTSPHYLYYGEAGTGHIYRIDLVTGAEERVSNTTIPSAHHMSFSDDGSIIAARSGYTGTNDVIVGVMSASSSLETTILNETILDFTLRDNTLMYLVPTPGGATARTRNIETFATRDLFTIPFSQATMVWGASADSTHYVYPRASFAAEGYLYEINGRTMTRLPISGNGLVADARDNDIIFALRNDQKNLVGFSFTASGTIGISPTPLPEKCSFSVTDTTTVWCAQTYDIPLPNQYPDSWYQGLATYNDYIWEIDYTAGYATLLAKPEDRVGQMLDIIDMTTAASDEALFFINRVDNTLWMYDLTY